MGYNLYINKFIHELLHLYSMTNVSIFSIPHQSKVHLTTSMSDPLTKSTSYI